MPDGSQREYALFIPPQYNDDPAHRWPVILFLHGSAECGSDGIKQTRVGLPKYIARHANQFPFITVMPQAHSLWFRGKDAEAVWITLDTVLKEYRADRDRVYITGLSMGAFATWEMAMARPDVFAAAVPISGVGNKKFVSNILHMPVWAFHGRLDRHVPVSGSREPIAELRRLGARPRYTEYPNLKHNCWDRSYADKRLWRWLLKQRRPPTPRVIDYILPGRLAHVWWLVAEAGKGLKTPARVHAQVTEDQRGKQIEINSSGVVAWALVSQSEPLKPGALLTITWNGKTLGQGRFTGRIAYPPRVASESRPVTQPAREPTTRPAH